MYISDLPCKISFRMRFAAEDGGLWPAGLRMRDIVEALRRAQSQGMHVDP
jgi:hypothetical protein